MDSFKSSQFPNSIAGFGYHFKDGELRHIETNKPFNFLVKENDISYNQQHYEALGEVINEEIYSILKGRCDLKTLPVPKDCSINEPSSMIFASDGYEKAEKLIVLIHGSGVVRAGQWARRLIINNSLDAGTQIPFIEKAISLGFGVVVLNTNDNNRNGILIRGSENPDKHAYYVWKEYIENCAASNIYIIAHSFGGVVTLNLFQKFKSFFSKRVSAVALTDSVHFMGRVSDFTQLLKISRNWVTSDKPLDSPVNKIDDIPCVSAGVKQHEWTSTNSMESIFKFFANMDELSLQEI